MTKIVHCRKEDFDVFIGRPSQWGNPFKIGIHGTREEVVAKYREWILNGDGQYLLDEIDDLYGKTLGCYCKPEDCHGDVLLEIIEERHNSER